VENSVNELQGRNGLTTGEITIFLQHKTFRLLKVTPMPCNLGTYIAKIKQASIS
jgi:hypothetical protein